ncbi:phosphate transport system regulatory protein PhoU [Clostridia bacterium]|nr:phosphate transport system regulatory protein PhoU [Clostridia bacterium]
MINSRQNFDTELEELSEDLIKMGESATTAIDRAIDAFHTGDKELMKKVVKGDRKINEMERNIEQRCLRLLLKQQPVASDLRKISTAIKMITDIERIGDAAADIAEISLHLNIPSSLGVLEDITNMAKIAREMVSDAIDSYVKEDLDLAQKTREKDDLVDEHFLRIRGILGEKIREDIEIMDEAMDYVMIIKYLERIGDHAENLCEWVEFYKTGVYKYERIL